MVNGELLCALKVCHLKGRSRERGLLKAGFAEVGIVKNRFPQVRHVEISFGEDAVTQVRPREVMSV